MGTVVLVAVKEYVELVAEEASTSNTLQRKFGWWYSAQNLLPFFVF